MPFLNKNLQFDTPEAFAAWLFNQPKPNWSPVGSTYHNTYKPNQAEWAGHASMLSMQTTYEAKGWDRGPHLYLAVGTRHDGIWVMTTPAAYGIHAGPCNDGPDGRFGIEIVDDLSTSPMSEAQLQLLVDCTAILHRWAGLPADINAHRDCMEGRTCPGDAGYAQKPEIQRRLAAALAELPRGPVQSHGLVLTHTSSLDQLEDAIIVGSYSLLKVVTAWGLPTAWQPQTIARACALTCETLVRTAVGDPSSGRPYPHSEEIPAELDPWYAVRRSRLLIEIGNEPNSDPQIDPSGYAWHLSRAIDVCRERYPLARLIAPALLLDRGAPERWLNNPDVARAIRRCDMVAIHAYAYRQFDDTGQLALAQKLYQPFASMRWALTEYGINDPATSDSTKGQRYAALVKSLPSPYSLATFYHHDSASTSGNDAYYAMGIDGDRAYGQAWRSQ